MLKRLIKKINKKWEKRKWTMYLFYNGILIKKVKISTAEEIDTIFVRVIGHKALFGHHIVGLMVKPIKLLKTDEKGKKTYWGVIFEKGEEV